MRINKSVFQLLTGISLLSLVACSSVDSTSSSDALEQEEAQTNVADYLCADTPLQVMFHGDEAQILWKGQTYDLTQAISASGSYYLGEEIAFWIKGHEAGLEINDLSRIECRLVRVES